jgi:hypothetical protein
VLTYLVVAGHRVGERAVLQGQSLLGAAGAVLLQTAEPRRWLDGSGTCEVWTWESSPAESEVGHVATLPNGGLAALAGTAWAKTGHASARGLSDSFPGSTTPQAVRAALVGEYSVVHLDQRGLGFVATDATGTGHVYWAESNGVVAISNRAPLAAIGAFGGWEPDVASGAWSAMLAMYAGSVTSIKGVHLLPASSAILLGGTDPGAWRICEDPTPWQVGREARDRASDLLDDAAAELVDFARAVVSAPGRPVVQLSGGKDARLVLAALRAAGCAAEVDYLTVGYPGASDREVALLLGKNFDLPLAAVELGSDGLPSLEDIDRRSRRHAFHTAGMLGGFNLKGDLGVSATVGMTGLYGELMRGHYKLPQDIGTPDALITHLTNAMSWDALGLLNQATRHRLDEELGTWARDRLAQGWPIADMLDLFYAETRISRWVGAATESNSLTMTANLLQHPACIRAGFGSPASLRHQDGLHYRLIERLDPASLTVPLANDSWHLDLAPLGSPHNPEPLTNKITGSQSWQIRGWPEYRHLIGAELLASDNPLHEYLDLDALRSAVKSKKARRLAGQTQLWALWTNSLWATDGYERFTWNGPATPAQVRPSRLVAAIEMRGGKQPAAGHSNEEDARTSHAKHSPHASPSAPTPPPRRRTRWTRRTRKA